MILYHKSDAMVKYKSKNIRESKKCNDKLPVEVLFPSFLI